ncbi:endoribonuclease L-PSP, partial [Candidatus Pacearchaeota archaeon]|nr:endoribonuclease L-PSP [Candidatus Pacearchaeota archaeon]
MNAKKLKTHPNADALNLQLLSMQPIAVSGINTSPIVIDNQVIGRWYEDDYARYCWLGNILPQDKGASRENQSHSVFQVMNTALSQCDMQFTDIVRTWYFLDHLLDWYDGFNRVRTKFMTENGVFKKFVPASTGIGSANPFGAALIVSAIAIKPKTDLFSIKTVPSPLQCPALDYKSSFSRAVETTCPTHRFLYISGTASISTKGMSMYRDDVARQIKLTMQVVESLL